MNSGINNAYFEKTTGLSKGVAPAGTVEKDYIYFWQLWHHNWDDMDAESVKELCVLKNKRVLEIGCGDARLTFALAAHCGSITGVDTEERFIEIARRRLKECNPGNIDFLVGDAQHLQCAGDSFDVVLFPWVLQMVNDPILAVREAFRVLRTGGQMMVIGLRSDSDYDAIIKEFCSQAFVIDLESTYENPIRHIFGSDGREILMQSRQFDYFFADLDIAQEAFLFALNQWYSTMLDEPGKAKLRSLLTSYLLDKQVRLRFPASIFLAKK